MKKNSIVLTDSYKVGHWPQYPKGTENVHSYLESRGGKFPFTVFFGLQYILQTYLEGIVVDQEAIMDAKNIFAAHFGRPDLFNVKGWEYIRTHHNGRLPVVIKAVPEGTVVNTNNVLMTIEVTDPKCYWLTNYLETLLVQVWYPITVATQSYYMKKMITKYLEETGNPGLVNFKLHDFGFRGVSSVESAAIGGAAHLTSFMGTDTMAALLLLRSHYDCEIAGFSIPASEHSTITSWGKENEAAAMENMLDTYPEGLVACVSDSFDIYKACADIWGTKLKDKIMNRKGCLVVRPDSGDPIDVVCKVLQILGDKFGYTLNDKGFKVLPDCIRVIQGDGCTFEMVDQVLNYMKINRWSADNIAFGMGGALLQKLDRDTQKFAFKCSAIKVNGEWRDVFKSPVTDSGKVSKKGRLKLLKVDGHSFTTAPADLPTTQEDHLVEVFRDGKVTKRYTFDEIRQRIK